MRTDQIYTRLTALFNRLARAGVAELVLSPGSRSAPLALTALRHKAFRCYQVTDERSAAYFGLGLAKRSKRPVGLICTSGTAAANYLPAIAEAYFQNIPLLVLTADRPSEWIGQADNQAIFQDGLFQKHVVFQATLPINDADSSAGWHSQRLVQEALENAIKQSRPAHLNIPFREPFYPESNSEALPIDIEEVAEIPQPRPTNRDLARAMSVFPQLKGAASIWIVLGMGDYNKETEIALSKLSRHSGISILLDGLCNISPAGGLESYDLWLDACEEKPDAVISIGDHFISKKLKASIRNCKPKIWRLSSNPEMIDTFQGFAESLDISPESFLSMLSKELSESQAPLDSLANLEFSAQERLKEWFEGSSFNEVWAAARILQDLPHEIDLHLGNSMPVRYGQYFAHWLREKQIRRFANRGTSGIDGSLSTAVGMAQQTGAQQVVLIGDLSFLYDRNGLWHQHVTANVKIIVLNNRGGGIFRVISGPSDQEELESYFTAKSSSAQSPEADDQIKLSAQANGLAYARATDQDTLADGMRELLESEKPFLLEVVFDETQQKNSFEHFINYVTAG